MTLRAAIPGDAPAIETFLQGHAETSMFLRSNLRAYGPCGGENAVATRMWLEGDPITGVLGISTAGYVTVQMPGGCPPACRDVLAGAEVQGITGASGQVTALGDTLGLLTADEIANPRDEPLYRLSLDALAVPEGPGTLRRATEADLDHLTQWRRASEAETSGLNGTLASARANVARWLADGRLWLLEEDGVPLAMTGFNAQLPDMVQIGGVYTPPERRNRGHARRAVALQLAETRAMGAETAILFAANAAAARAYEGIGFTRIGTYQLLLFPEGRRVRAAA